MVMRVWHAGESCFSLGVVVGQISAWHTMEQVDVRARGWQRLGRGRKPRDADAACTPDLWRCGRLAQKASERTLDLGRCADI
jgi:hypothetical protein